MSKIEKSTRFLALIPARGGSKGIPRKNLVPLGGKPMVQYTIEAALNSKRVSHVLLSTDDAEIHKFASGFCGLNCEYIRPKHIASDSAAMIDVIVDAITWLKNNDYPAFDHVVLLQPTSPLRTAQDIDEAIELYLKSKSSALISVSEMLQHPYECLFFPSSKKGTTRWEYLRTPKKRTFRRQDYQEKFYFINGAIYIRKIQSILRDRLTIVEGKSQLFYMPSERSIDIDTNLDLSIARLLLDQKNN